MRKLFSIFVFIWLFVLLNGCSSQSAKGLADYPVVTRHFSEQEVADLQVLLNLFENEIGVKHGASAGEVGAGYVAFNRKLVDFLMSEDPDKTFLLSFQTRTKLLDELHIGTFRSIWFTSVCTFRDSGDCRVCSNISTTGKFVSFLGDVGNEFPKLAGLHDGIVRSGALTPDFVATVFQNFEQLNTEDPRIHLVYVIGCLSWGMNWGLISE